MDDPPSLRRLHYLRYALLEFVKELDAQSMDLLFVEAGGLYNLGFRRSVIDQFHSMALRAARITCS